MKTKLVAKSLEEDLASLGVRGLDENTMVAVALGQSALSEKFAPKKGDDEEEPDEDEEEGDDEDGEEYDESVHDAIDGPFVTPALFDRIMSLPFDTLDEEQIEQVIEGLKVKKIPSNIGGIEERADAVARKLVSEATAKRVRRSRAHSMSKKASYQCPPGMRKDPKDPSGKRCIRAMAAVGGAGKLAKMKRKQKKWAKSGKGAKSARISARWSDRRPGSQNSSFAVELEHLLSENQDFNTNIRSEILDHIDCIVEMIVDEFCDENVMSVFNEAIEPVAASFEAGRLDEDVMSTDSFLSEIKPVMTLISKSLDRIEKDDLGN